MVERRIQKKGAPYLDWPFARQCERAQDLNDLCDLLAVEFTRLGFPLFCCCTHVRPDAPPAGAIFLQNYPSAWVRLYVQRQLWRVDPIFVVGRTFTRPFRWDDPAFLDLLEPEQRAVLDEAARFGLVHGVTIPLHGPRSRSASCSLIATTPYIDPDAVHLAQHYALYAYEAARDLVGPEDGRPRVVLPRREKQVLTLIAAGKSNDEIATILSLEPDTINKYAQSAKQRLNADTRAHAVAYGIYTEALNLEDIFGM